MGPSGDLREIFEEAEVFRIPNVHCIVKKRDELKGFGTDGKVIQVVPGGDNMLGDAAAGAQNIDERAAGGRAGVKIRLPGTARATNQFLAAFEFQAPLDKEKLDFLGSTFDRAGSHGAPKIGCLEARRLLYPAAANSSGAYGLRR